MNGNGYKELRGCVIDVRRLCEIDRIKQVGVIKYGGGCNHRAAIAAERAKGRMVSEKDDHALVFALKGQKEAV